MEDDFIKKLRNNEIEAWNKVYKDCFLKSTSWLFHNGLSLEDRQDMFQIALMRFAIKLKDNSFVLTSKVCTFLYSIVKFIDLEENRKNGKMENVSLQDEILVQVENKFDQQNNVSENDHVNVRAYEYINSLDGRCKEIMTLFYLEEWSLDRIANHLNITKASVKVRKSQCIKKLKNK